MARDQLFARLQHQEARENSPSTGTRSEWLPTARGRLVRVIRNREKDAEPVKEDISGATRPFRNGMFVHATLSQSEARLIAKTAKIAQSTTADVTTWTILLRKKLLGLWMSRTFSGLRGLRARSKHGNEQAFSPFLRWICSPPSISVAFPQLTCA